MGKAGTAMLVAALAVAVTRVAIGSARAEEPLPRAAASQPAAVAAQTAVPQLSEQGAGQTAEACPGHPDAIGTSRVLAIDPAEFPRVGRMQYPTSLPLNDKEVVLTFDDGPLLPYSNQILDILASQCVKATYFLIGEMARAFPATVRRIYEEGHTIGTHSEDHPTRFGQLPVEKMREEIDWGISDVSAALGDPRYLAPFFRIPGLARSDALESELAARGLTVFSSDTVADDWHHRITGKQIIAAAMRRLGARGKGILLLHDIHPATVAALPGLLKELKDNGFHIVQVVPAASYVIAMADKPKARMVASVLPASARVDGNIDRSAEPSWPQAATSIAPESGALPVPDVAAFEPDAVASEDASDVQWPAQPQVTTPSDAKSRARSHKHKSARASGNRRVHAAHAGKPEHRAQHAHSSRRARARADGHHAEATPGLKTFAALITPGHAARS
jgi:peptidoglycan/xylan/chitin deacetylase (PgdA/CDA1 family)